MPHVVSAGRSLLRSGQREGEGRRSWRRARGALGWASPEAASPPCRQAGLVAGVRGPGVGGLPRRTEGLSSLVPAAPWPRERSPRALVPGQGLDRGTAPQGPFPQRRASPGLELAVRTKVSE